jgi:hypothetical protein
VNIDVRHTHTYTHIERERERERKDRDLCEAGAGDDNTLQKLKIEVPQYALQHSLKEFLQCLLPRA